MSLELLYFTGGEAARLRVTIGGTSREENVRNVMSKIDGLLAEATLSAAEQSLIARPAASALGLINVLSQNIGTISAAPSVTASLPEVLAQMARVLPLRRFVITENPAAPGEGTSLLFHWQAASQTAAEAPRWLQVLLAHTPPRDWLEPLTGGHQVLVQAESSAELRALLAESRTCSLLVIPIMVDGYHWGTIGFEDTEGALGWQAEELRVLGMLAEVIGAALTRERMLWQVRSHEALLKAINQSATLIMAATELQPAIARALGTAAQVMGVDRVFVAEEIAAAPDEGPRRQLRCVWRARGTPLMLAELVRLLSAPYPPDVASWLEPLAQGVAVQARLSSSEGAVRELLRQFRCSALLMVPIMVAARYWGYICLSSGAAERGFRRAEIDVLKTLAKLIGTAIAHERQVQANIAQLARSDALTGLANRITFNDRLRQAFAASQRGAHSFAVLYLDLDRFKEINDTLGHHTGDLLLQQVATRLREATREIDVVARLGGDEFAIVQSELIDSASAGTLAEKVIEIVSTPFEVAGNQLHVGVSVGIAVYSAESHSPDELLAQADQALYRAKHAGRGRYRFHSDQIDHETRAQLQLADALRGAIERNELEMRYQPQVELASGRIVGMEALLRWNHPTRGVLLPEDFLPIAEKYGLMQQLGRWVLGEACHQMSRWRAQQMAVPVVAINVALAQIRMGREFVRDVMDALTRWALNPSDIELDVTELVLARSTLTQNGVLEELRQLGVRIAIDNFGAQYSSLDYLRNYRVSRLKIARGMVAAADAEPGGGAMIRAILSLARELGIEVVAEGVETESQCRLLVDASAHAQGQGFYFSHAVSAEDTMNMLRTGVMMPVEGEAPARTQGLG
jgi:diguanylate cyclase (GGDEF)-like protein